MCRVCQSARLSTALPLCCTHSESLVRSLSSLLSVYIEELQGEEEKEGEEGEEEEDCSPASNLKCTGTNAQSQREQSQVLVVGLTINQTQRTETKSQPSISKGEEVSSRRQKNTTGRIRNTGDCGTTRRTIRNLETRTRRETENMLRGSKHRETCERSVTKTIR